MKKYLQLAKVDFQGYLVYRLNFILWRFRSLVVFLTLIFFWLAVYGSKNNFLNYGREQMFTYLVGIVFLRSLVMGTTTGQLASYIRSGEIGMWLLRPLRMFSLWFTLDLTDKFVNLFFSLIEIGLVLFLFKFPLYFPTQPETYFFFLLIILLAIILYFFINFFLSVVSFWTDEIWALRFLFGFIFFEFFSGALFPIDILPQSLSKIISYTPFPYMIFYPLKIWLEQESEIPFLNVFLIIFFWIGLFYFLSVFLWKKGLKSYSPYGG